MAAAVNAGFLVAAIAFMVVAYLADAGAHGVPDDAPTSAAVWGLSPRVVYRLAIWLGPGSLAGLAAHLTVSSVLALGPGASLVFLPVAVLLLLTALALAVQVGRRA